MSSEKKPTRFDQVKTLLNEAAQDSQADYGGIGRFWDQDLNTLLNARILGVSMIAPKPATCCCPTDDSKKALRSSASGLIIGLKGDAPFDGSQFPRLPWGGKAVPPEGIAFIADWIDDDCPNDHENTVDVGILNVESKLAHIQVKDLAELDLADKARRRPTRPGELRQRVNLDCMGEEEITRLRNAFQKLYDLDKYTQDVRSYNNQALIHQNHCQHGWERFLTWHRAYLYEFEQNLQDFDSDITLPYWDWVMPQYRPDKPEDGWIIPQYFQAFLTPENTESMLGKLDPAPSEAQRHAFLKLAQDKQLFTSQSKFFQHVYNVIGYTAVMPSPDDDNRKLMIDALLDSNPLWYPLRFPAEYQGGDSINKAIHYHYPSPEDICHILSLNNFRDFGGGSIYDASFGFLDQNPHNTLHIWTGGKNPYPYDKDKPLASYATPCANHTGTAQLQGERRNTMVKAGGRDFHRRKDLYSLPAYGDMFSNLTASYDPVFWPIHVNVDRLWWEWQQHNPNGQPADIDAILSPWNYTARDTLDIARFGYDYVRDSYFIPVGLDAPVGRIVSKPIPIREITKGFRKAEIRLHWVPQLARSCFIRAFLNEPGANAHTALNGNPNFAGYIAIFGHGACYGGPGHCDMPPPRPRDYDHRTPSHNAPRNHRIDITDCAKKLLDQNAKSLQITLVVIGADYEEEIDLLKLEGVSLNFLD